MILKKFHGREISNQSRSNKKQKHTLELISVKSKPRQGKKISRPLPWWCMEEVFSEQSRIICAMSFAPWAYKGTTEQELFKFTPRT